MIDERFVFLGALLSLIGNFKYILETVNGRVKPNRVSFFLWSLAPLIAFCCRDSKRCRNSVFDDFQRGFFTTHYLHSIIF